MNSQVYKAYIGMAFYQNLTLLNKTLDSKNIENLSSIFSQRQLNLESSESLFRNNFVHNLKVSRENWPHVSLSCLLIQIKYCVFYSQAALIKPLSKLINQPGSHVNKYLPTMPTDTFYDAFFSLAKGNSHGLYACPNNHLYFIGDVSIRLG